MSKPFDPRPTQRTYLGRTKWEVDCRGWAPIMTALGEPKRKRFDSEAEALQWCRSLIVAQATGRKRATPEATVSSYADRYLRSCEHSDLAPGTVRGYTSALTKNFVPFMREAGVLYLDQVTPESIDEYRQYLVATLKPRTVRSYMTYVKVMFAWGVKLKLFDSNPALGLVPRERDSDRRPLTDEQRKLVVTKAEHRNFWIAYLITGMRTAEFAGLLVEDVHIDTPSPLLRVTGKGSKTRVVHLKGESSVGHFRKLVRLARDRGDLMLSPVRTGRIQQLWREDRAALELPTDLKIHNLRHSYGTFMAQRDPVGTRDSMGHADIKTTMLYVHQDDRMAREIAAQWSAVLDSDAQADGTDLVSAPEKAHHSGPE